MTAKNSILKIFELKIKRIKHRRKIKSMYNIKIIKPWGKMERKKRIHNGALFLFPDLKDLKR